MNHCSFRKKEEHGQRPIFETSWRGEKLNNLGIRKLLTLAFHKWL